MFNKSFYLLLIILLSVPLYAQTPLSVTTTTCSSALQGAAYSGCTITATGGQPPYTFSVSGSTLYSTLPEGLSLNSTSGLISGTQVGGQGTYVPGIVVRDASGATATQGISFSVTGSNAFLSSIFPSNSIFHHRVDEATTGLPVDSSPAAPIYSGYLTETVKPFFGGAAYANYPNGIPAFQVPCSQPDVGVTTTVYQSYFTSGPFPANAPIEGTANGLLSGGDAHVLIYQQAGCGNPPKLWEMWQGAYEGGPWTDSSNALWADVTSNTLTPLGNGTTDAAGLPVAPLLLNADEVIGTGTPSAPNGVVQHPTRFTLNHGVNYYVWPATASAGVGSCDSGSTTIATDTELSQSSHPRLVP